MMDEMSKENINQAIELMDTESVVMGILSSPLHFAYEHHLYEIIAHICAQKNVSRRWYNSLPPNLRPFFKSAIQEPLRFVTAPFTKYVANSIFLFIMVIMFSGFLMTSINRKYDYRFYTHLSTYFIYVWSIGDVVEEITSFFGGLDTRHLSCRKPFSRTKRFLRNFWNVADMLSYIFLIAGIAVRELSNDETLNNARRMFGFSLIFMYLRCLKVFLVDRTMGPTLIMIKEMVKDLLVFMFIAVFVMLSVGIYYLANLCPDRQLDWNEEGTVVTLWNVFVFPYWQLNGELYKEYIYGTEELPCVNYQLDRSVPIVAAIYVLFSNILLTNLVIAEFSYTFEKVQDNAGKLWSFEMYTIIHDYKWRIPSPINLVFAVPRLVYFSRNCKKTKVSEEQKDNKLKKYREDFQKSAALSITNSGLGVN